MTSVQKTCAETISRGAHERIYRSQFFSGWKSIHKNSTIVSSSLLLLASNTWRGGSVDGAWWRGTTYYRIVYCSVYSSTSKCCGPACYGFWLGGLDGCRLRLALIAAGASGIAEAWNTHITSIPLENFGIRNSMQKNKQLYT